MTVHMTRHGNTKLPYLVEATIDLTDAVASGALTAITIPAESMVIGAGAELVEAMTGTSANLTATVRTNTTAYTGALAIAAATEEGTYAASAALTPVVTAAGTTVNVLMSAFTGTVTAGKLRVFAVVVDVKDKVSNGIAQIGS